MTGTRIKRLLATGAIFGTGLSTGCSTMSNTEKGVGLGAAGGAGVGTLIGAATGNPKTGAVVGGLLGAAVGGSVGAEADQKAADRADARRVNAEVAAAQPGGPLGVPDVISFTQQKMSDDLIISYMRQSHSTFRLSPADVTMLKENGVSDRVVTEMINSPARVAIAPPRTVIVHPAPPPVVVYEQPYYRPVYGYGYYGRGRW